MTELTGSSTAAALTVPPPAAITAPAHPPATRIPGRHVGAGPAHTSRAVDAWQVGASDELGLRAVVAMAQQSVESCDLATGMVTHDGDPRVSTASDDVVIDLDQLQLDLEDGPGLHACGTTSIVSTVDLRIDARWPSLRPHADRYGLAAAVWIPLTPAPAFPSWAGWLTLYSRQPGPFPPASMALAHTLGRYFSTTVSNALRARNLDAALASRDVIGQAKGILMARKNVDDAQAFALLQQASQHTNRRLRDVADAVVRSCGRQGLPG